MAFCLDCDAEIVLQRKNGLFKKAYELGVLCSVDVCVVIFGALHPTLLPTLSLIPYQRKRLDIPSSSSSTALATLPVSSSVVATYVCLTGTFSPLQLFIAPIAISGTNLGFNSSTEKRTAKVLTTLPTRKMMTMMTTTTFTLILLPQVQEKIPRRAQFSEGFSFSGLTLFRLSAIYSRGPSDAVSSFSATAWHVSANTAVSSSAIPPAAFVGFTRSQALALRLWLRSNRQFPVVRKSS